MAKLTMYQSVRMVLKNNGRVVGALSEVVQLPVMREIGTGGVMYSVRTAVDTAVGHI